MKKVTKMTLLTTALLPLLAGCSSQASKETAAGSDAVETTKSSNETSHLSAETVSFFAEGEYQEGTDIQTGTYYMVLTDIQYDSSDEKKEAEIYVSIKDSKGNYKTAESLKEIGKPYRVTIEEGDQISLNEFYDLKSWNVTFFTDKDYKEYQSSEKK